MQAFIQGLPKAELHVHLEGTFEAEHILAMAVRNGIDLGYDSADALRQAHVFHDLPSFLKIYYAAMSALQTEQDFYELAYAYFEKAAAQNIVYAEPFFDPQGHTSRGVAFETVIQGIYRAQMDAKQNLSVDSQLIMCFLRDMSAESAMEHLELSLPYKDWIVGVGLDSDEKGNPPNKFAEVFARARSEGYLLTMHCDVNQENTTLHINQCLHDIRVDRIDHGVNALEDTRACQVIAERGTGLTICPVSNHYVVGTYTTDEIRALLQKGIKATINSDDPAYFRAYLNDNLMALVREGDFTGAEILQLVENSFYASWMPFEQKRERMNEVRRFAEAMAAAA